MLMTATGEQLHIAWGHDLLVVFKDRDSYQVVSLCKLLSIKSKLAAEVQSAAFAM